MSNDAANEQDYYPYTGQKSWGIWNVTHVRVHPSVGAIKAKAFHSCSQLSTVILNDGLEEIGRRAFYGCTSLVHIAIPPAVRAIKGRAFSDCRQLSTVILNDELEEIGGFALAECTSLIHIAIPPAVRAIKDEAFSGCSELTNAIINDGLEEKLGRGHLPDACPSYTSQSPPLSGRSRILHSVNAWG
jgi:hypothetical protein